MMAERGLTMAHTTTMRWPLDREGNTVDYLSEQRDVAAAKGFMRKAMKTQGRAPASVTLDGYAASHRAVREFAAENRRCRRVRLARRST
jgi:transposase-like protein